MITTMHSARGMPQWRFEKRTTRRIYKNILKSAIDVKIPVRPLAEPELINNGYSGNG